MGMSTRKAHTLLLADDHTVVRAGIRKALEDLSDITIVEEVGDGPSLFAALERHHPDLLLIDIAMPAFDPLNDIRVIRSRYPETRILVVSAYDDDVYVQGLFRIGVDGYHLKDQPLSDLRLAVQRVLRGEKWVCGPLLEKLLTYASIHTDRPAAHHLSPRQKEILRLLDEGLDNQSIARRLNLSVKTVENHLTRIYRLLGVNSRVEAINLLRRHPYVLQQGPERLHTLLPLETRSVASEQFSVLVVDDNPRYRRQLHYMIVRAVPQVEVYEAESIEEAMTIVRAKQPALAFVDVILRGQDGIRCVRQLKALAPTMRLVLISAYPDREFHRQGLEAGAIAFVDKKDLDLTTLRHILEDALSTT